MKSNRKVYIILIIILIVFSLLLYFNFGKKEKEDLDKKVTIFTGDNDVFELNNKSWRYVNNPRELEEYNWQKFSLYLDNEYKGKYYLWHDDKWYAFNENKEAINYTERFLGINANFNIKIKKFNTEQNENEMYLSKVLKEHNISPDTQLMVNSVINVDIDNDNKEESIYIVSNTFPIDFEPNQIFAFVFMVKDEKIYMMYENQINGDIYSGCQPYISSIIDVDDDNNYEIILSCAEYSVQDLKNSIYKFSDNQFKILISNE